MFAPRAGLWLAALAIPPLGLAMLLAVGLLPAAPAEIALTAALGAVWIFLAAFFRDPDRELGRGIVSPADGRVMLLSREGGSVRIGVFMNVTDVHVNRFPLDARVDSVGDGGRGHAPAYAPRAGGNVQRAYRLATPLGEVSVVQVTGILARRLVSFVRPGERHAKGDRLGMIVLGSRVDVLLPEARVEVAVRVGDRVWAGRSTLATEKP